MACYNLVSNNYTPVFAYRNNNIGLFSVATARQTQLPLIDRWQQLADKHCDGEQISKRIFFDITKFYSEPHRAYHTLNHLRAMFADIDLAGIDNDAIDFSAWFHDIIYQPGARDNESQSALFAAKTMNAMQIDKAMIEQVTYMINCTQNHSNPDNDHHTQLFLDVDMAILGSIPAHYEVYVEQIRKEFSLLPQNAFEQGRLMFVKEVIEQPRIFVSDTFYAQYEDQARNNLQWELESLINKSDNS